ncbi:CobW family GTP-binding protein [Staphylococcus canis]|uniref:GTP-binding protein n=1 Tax=Staphylococcus canis TaxID=2724942 RepID=A0ABS0T712_9STAP|nr:GTP-binding protein [Staphylococcus canis]
MDIIILTGFLGSGKTSLLNALIRDAKNKSLQMAVVMNDFGHQNVDAHLVDNDVSVTPLTDGCVCCTLKADLTTQLHELYLSHQPDVVFVECSGIAHPIDVLDACLTPVLASITNHVHLVGIIDAVAMQQRESYPETVQHLMAEQLKYTSTICINKIDLVDTTELAHVTQVVQDTYPHTPYYLTQNGDMTLDEISKLAHIPHSTTTHHHAHMTHFLYEIERPVRQHALIECLKQLPKSVYRVKGFVDFSDDDTQKSVQYVPYHLDLKTTQVSLPSYLVVIGYEMDTEQLRSQFDEMIFAS